MKNFFSFLMIICLLGACKSQESVFYGEEFSAKEALTAEQMLDKMGESEELATTVKGNVTAVCQVKGCWMRMTTESGDEIMVTFKDYGFFVPLDLTGEVAMAGKAYRQVTSVDELRHLAEDGGATPEEIEKITEPKEELRFEASGVQIL